MDSLKAKSEIELLELLLDNISKLTTGLCKLIGDIRSERLINNYEKDILDDIIRNNPTSRYKYTDSLFYFIKGDIPSRQLYIRVLIRKLKRK